MVAEFAIGLCRFKNWLSKFRLHSSDLNKSSFPEFEDALSKCKKLVTQFVVALRGFENLVGLFAVVLLRFKNSVVKFSLHFIVFHACLAL